MDDGSDKENRTPQAVPPVQHDDARAIYKLPEQLKEWYPAEHPSIINTTDSDHPEETPYACDMMGRPLYRAAILPEATPLYTTSGLRARPQSPRPAQDGRPKPGRDWDEKWVLGGLMAQSSLLAFGSHSPTSEASIVGDARPGLRIPWENATYDRCSPFAFKIGSTPDPSEPHPHPLIFPSRVYSPLRNLIRPFYASGFLLQLVTLMFYDSPNWQKNWPLTIPVSLSSHLVAGLLCLPLHAATVICNWLHIVHNLKVMLHVTTLATTPPCSRSLRAAFASNLGVRSQMSSDKVSRTHNLATQALIRVDLSAQRVRIVISTAPHESQTLAFNYASLALNNSFFLHHLKPPTPPAQNHESTLTGKPLNHEARTRLPTSSPRSRLG
ncbi:hypothetical protein EDB89DRAFT_2081800 [Lactarius sanguifluus]|nr:hypothetical protein EDB89DRAFT_2081800 [Lactarius sanguifluus]